MMPPQPSDGFEWTQVPWGVALRNRPLLAVSDHLFTTGNLQLRDDPQEWKLVASSLGVHGILLIRQVHRADVAVASQGRSEPWPRPEADIIVSDDRAVAIGVRVADCAPILLGDERRGVVAAVHAGWRGTVRRAAIAGVRALSAEFGSDPRDLIAAIGPCLGSCCGEVGEEVVEAFRTASHAGADIARWFSPGPNGRPHLDLVGANRDQLAAAGVPGDRIHAAQLCTRTHPDILHSYRAGGTSAGRMVGVIRAGRRG